MRLVLFDIDGTLVTGPSTEKRFYLHLLRTGNQGPRQVLAATVFLCRWSPVYGHHVFKKNKAYLAWLRVDKIRQLADGWVAHALQQAWFEPCVERLRRHLADGDQVVLLSGTPDFVAQAIARQLGVATAIGSECAQRDGRFGWAPPLCHPFAEEKRRIAQRLCARYGVEPENVVAYGDSVHDLALLEWVGTPVAVRPDSHLESVASERGWEILGERGAPADGSDSLSVPRG